MPGSHVLERPGAEAFTAASLAERNLYRRAVEAVIWGMPAVNFDQMREAAARELKARPNQVVYWSRPSTWKNQTLTPNPDTIYLMPFFDTADVGPVVLEIPPADAGTIVGSIDDGWQTALEDVGPAGADKGQGGKYLILPPGYAGDVPDGYIARRSDTFQAYALLRSNPRSHSDADIATAVAYGMRCQVYPLSHATSPPPTVYLDAADIVFDSTIPYDLRFFRSLDRFVQAEPWIDRDRLMVDKLRSIGIEKGKPFAPDARAEALLAEAAAEAHQWLSLSYEAVFEPPFAPGARWALPGSHELIESMESDYGVPGSYPVDARAVTYHMAFFSAKKLGGGQFYLMAIGDKDGQPLNGANTYRLTVPADAPVKQYWSATVYDRTTHTLVRNAATSSCSSLTPNLQAKADGSVDVYFGPKALSGAAAANFVPTSPDGAFEVLFRFYGPTGALVDRSWVLPDIEKIG